MNRPSRTPRRRFLRSTSALAAAGALGLPSLARAQAAAVKIGVIHPVTGPLAYSGQLCRLGAKIAIDEINAAGGIRGLGGAKLEPIYADAPNPQAGTAEVEKANEAGVAAIVGAYASAICLATTQAAAKYSLPHLVDVGVADQIVERGLTNTFRFGPGYRKTTEDAVKYLHTINTLAGNPAKTVFIVHEESLFGTGTANLLSQELPKLGFEVKEVIKHANPTRDFSNIVLRMKAVNADIVIPANYYNEYALLVRTMKQQGVRPMAIYSVLGGAASSFKFLAEFPDVASGIIDVNHWYNPANKQALALRRKVEAMKDQYFTYEVFLNYENVYLLADALERAKSASRETITQALASSQWNGHFMPYGPTKFVNGQNTGAQPLTMQVRDKDIKVVLPGLFAQVPPVFPWKG
ncbi:MAG: ABC transporter substrate-binding protein [Burkholderiales bacterium]